MKYQYMSHKYASSVLFEPEVLPGTGTCVYACLKSDIRISRGGGMHIYHKYTHYYYYYYHYYYYYY